MITINELRIEIKKLELEIKEIKGELRKDHSTFNSCAAMEKLHNRKGTIRAYYLLYGFFRGKALYEIERKTRQERPTWWFAAIVKQHLDEDGLDLFRKWMKETTEETPTST